MCLAGELSKGEPKRTRCLALTEFENISLWSVHVLASSEDAAGVQADAGLQFGGRVRLLLLAASLPMGRSPSIGLQGFRVHRNARALQRHATAMALLPDQPDQFVVAANSDAILRGSLYGQMPVPQVSLCYEPVE